MKIERKTKGKEVMGARCGVRGKGNRTTPACRQAGKPQILLTCWLKLKLKRYEKPAVSIRSANNYSLIRFM